MRVVGLQSYDIEVTEVKLKRTDYENQVVQLVKALLEIDRAMKQQQDQASDQSTASEMKEAR
ncbi:hypothetical protein [Bdellovibrio svalbardensis]|uniref:Uncharacterized protein n=1 Tax=Bdellovibrio svalbardensis TaxID=2972972 RepID=A0ABT6DN07_9BACT|nr:hypothetical protein [Bdellovibrio svalbardensis]MDG0818258.1 hypothetical protein [Bdellovibrio svalbardensis]